MILRYEIKFDDDKMILLILLYTRTLTFFCILRFHTQTLSFSISLHKNLDDYKQIEVMS